MKDADSVKNVARVLKQFPEESLVVVVSAMGKTTNELEKLVACHLQGHKNKTLKQLKFIRDFHMTIVNGLFGKEDAVEGLENLLSELETRSLKKPTTNEDFAYDQIVCYGELISTRIVAAYLNNVGMSCTWWDARDLILTDSTYREGKVNWKVTRERVRKNLLPKRKKHISLTQGFIGSTSQKHTTTLGREGSDYTAAILAHTLEAEEVTIWKDVPGVLNADPKWFDDTVLLPQLSYRDAIELSYYGATVIHPKTIQPLQNKKIPLRVRSFVNPKAKGTVIAEAHYRKLIPSFIFRIDQALLSIQAKDFSFIAEDNLSLIFSLFAKHRIKINVMQNSAISFLVAMDNNKKKVSALTKDLSKHFNVQSQTGHLELITIRYYDQKTIDRVCINKEILLEQKGPENVQLVVKDRG